MTTQQRGVLFVLVGPGGTGKNTLMNAVMAQHDNLKQLATATTRSMRPNEQQGREHLFVDQARFEEMIANNELLEYLQVTPGRYYGIPRASVTDAIETGQNLIADIEVIGAKIVYEAFPEDVVLIFVTVPGASIAERLAILRERMTARYSDHERTADEKQIQQRLERAEQLEFPFMEKCQYIIINDDVDQAIAELDAIVRQTLAERQLTPKQEEA